MGSAQPRGESCHESVLPAPGAPSWGSVQGEAGDWGAAGEADVCGAASSQLTQGQLQQCGANRQGRLRGGREGARGSRWYPNTFLRRRTTVRAQQMLYCQGQRFPRPLGGRGGGCLTVSRTDRQVLGAESQPRHHLPSLGPGEGWGELDSPACGTGTPPQRPALCPAPRPPPSTRPTRLPPGPVLCGRPGDVAGSPAKGEGAQQAGTDGEEAEGP